MEDDRLVRRAREGDDRAYGRLVERHQRRVYATLAKMTGDGDLAMDLAQEAFVRAWERLEDFEGRAAFSTWLYRIAVRLAYDAMERGKRRVDADVEHDRPDPGPAPDDRMVASETALDLRRRIERLPGLQRAVVILRAYDGLSYREIAAILDTTEGSARVSFHHAIRRLRTSFEEATPE